MDKILTTELEHAKFLNTLSGLPEPVGPYWYWAGSLLTTAVAEVAALKTYTQSPIGRHPARILMRNFNREMDFTVDGARRPIEFLDDTSREQYSENREEELATRWLGLICWRIKQDNPNKDIVEVLTRLADRGHTSTGLSNNGSLAFL